MRESPSLYQGERRVTSEDAGGVEPHRRTKMSLTIMTLNKMRSTVVTALRRRKRAASRFVVRSFGMMVGASGRARYGAQRLFGPRCRNFRQRRAGRQDHAPGAVERSVG
jgi:hypothetical protein